MRNFISPILVSIIIFSVSCGFYSEEEISIMTQKIESLEEENALLQEELISAQNAATRDICRANMRTIASQEVVYFSANTEFTTNIDDLGMTGIVCPGCNEEYNITAGTDSYGFIYYSITCPELHGRINNGLPSWR